MERTSHISESPLFSFSPCFHTPCLSGASGSLAVPHHHQPRPRSLASGVSTLPHRQLAYISPSFSFSCSSTAHLPPRPPPLPSWPRCSLPTPILHQDLEKGPRPPGEARGRVHQVGAGAGPGPVTELGLLRDCQKRTASSAGVEPSVTRKHAANGEDGHLSVYRTPLL